MRPSSSEEPRTRSFAFGPVAIAFDSDDAAARTWLAEALWPSFVPAPATPDWHVRASTRPGAFAEARRRLPKDAAPRIAFAHDTRVVSIPAAPEGARGVRLLDEERRCVLVVEPSKVELVADPASPRWRVTAMWVVHEIVATRLAASHLDAHAAAVETEGRALLLVGPKGAGKTTLSLHLLRSGRCRALGNDRAFVGGAATSFEVRGVPTAVRLRPGTVAEFPELARDLPNVERPYLYTEHELRAAGGEANPAAADTMLSPPQLLRRLGVEPVAAAPLGALLFPEIRSDFDGWTVERLDRSEVRALIWANRYGCRFGPRAPTVFEDVSGGRRAPSRELAAAVSDSVAGHRVVLGRQAYRDPAFASRLLDSVLGG